MRLIIKAHKYIRKWRAKNGKWQYEYARPAAGKGPRTVVPVPVEATPTKSDKAVSKLSVAKKVIEKYDLYNEPEEIAEWMDKAYPKVSASDIDSMIEAGMDEAEDKGFDGEFVFSRAIGYDEPLITAVLNQQTWDLVYDLANKGSERAGKRDDDYKIYPEDADEYMDTIIAEGLGNGFYSDIDDFENWIPTKAEMENLEYFWTPADLVFHAVRNKMSFKEVSQYIKDLNAAASDEILEDIDMPAYSDDLSRLYNTPDPGSVDAQHAITAGSIVGGKALGGGVNTSYKVQVQNGDYIEGVFKPGAYERDTITIHPEVPNGTQYIREVAAYVIDQAVGIGMVPPTTIKEIDGKVGSVQQYVDDASIAVSYFNYEIAGGIRGLDSEQVAKAALLDYLLESMDRHGENWMVDNDGDIYMIDNGFSLPSRDANIWNKSPFLSRFDNDLSQIVAELPLDVVNTLASIDNDGITEEIETMGIDDKAASRFSYRLGNASLMAKEVVNG